MTKTIKKLEKETLMWKGKWEKSNKNLVQMVEESARKDKEIATMRSKTDKLGDLCRALQKERKELSDKLQANDDTTVRIII